jgi:hypothetical protein
LPDNPVDGVERQPARREINVPIGRHHVRPVADVHNDGLAVEADNGVQ